MARKCGYGIIMNTDDFICNKTFRTNLTWTHGTNKYVFCALDSQLFASYVMFYFSAVKLSVHSFCVNILKHLSTKFSLFVVCTYLPIIGGKKEKRNYYCCRWWAGAFFIIATIEAETKRRKQGKQMWLRNIFTTT